VEATKPRVPKPKSLRCPSVSRGLSNLLTIVSLLIHDRVIRWSALKLHFSPCIAVSSGYAHRGRFLAPLSIGGAQVQRRRVPAFANCSTQAAWCSLAHSKRGDEATCEEGGGDSITDI